MLRKHKKLIVAGVLFLFVALLTRKLCFSFNLVHGQSMQPTLGNYALVFSIKMPLYKWMQKPLERGDIVITTLKFGSEKLIKRIVGLPDEEISIEEGLLKINQNTAQFEWNNKVLNNSNRIDCRFFESTVVPKNHYFLLGDNRCQAFDSRALGAINEGQIVSKVLWTVWGGFKK